LIVGFTVLAFSGIAAAGLFGLILARRALAPVAELSNAARDVAATQDATLPVPETGGVELVQLGASINTMLASLAEAREHERRLIDDAAHELRTPLTSLRTNIEVLTNGKPISDNDRSELLVDLRSQMEEFSSLVGDLDALARGDGDGDSEAEAVAVESVVDAAVRRAQRRAGGVQLVTEMHEPGWIVGTPPMLERAVLNVLDNAVKWSPADGVVRVEVRGTDITVCDDGPGIALADLPHVFDRFWRSPSSRSTPGSGLGLAIVRQVVNAHGGSIDIGAASRGGTRVHIWLPELDGASPNDN
jgi:two-component system, OmpR family, sensor histidine kinase MprB